MLVTAGCTSAGVAQPASSRQSGPPITVQARARNRHAQQHHHHARPPAATRRNGVPAVDVPRRSLTPGAAFVVGKARICVSGYSASVRNVPQAEATAVYDRYGVAHVPYAHEVDHLVSLEVGGSNAIANLWPEPYAGRWGARTKDVLENRLHELVCSGRLALRTAQRIEARDWVIAYRRYVGGTPRPAAIHPRPQAARTRAATTHPASARPAPSTAPTTATGASSAPGTSSTSAPGRLPAGASPPITCTSPAR
jgi:hypothetical protein